jgi:hypothetical protein
VSPVPLLAGPAAVLAAAWTAHQALIRYAALAAVVPGYPAWWYRLGLGRRAAVIAVLPAAGAMTGLAWVLSPAVAAVSYATVTAGMLVTAVIRAAARQRRQS